MLLLVVQISAGLTTEGKEKRPSEPPNTWAGFAGAWETRVVQSHKGRRGAGRHAERVITAAEMAKQFQSNSNTTDHHYEVEDPWSFCCCCWWWWWCRGHDAKEFSLNAMFICFLCFIFSFRFARAHVPSARSV